MKIIAGTTEFRIPEKTAVAIGKFDGVHIGHRKLLEKVLDQKENGLKSAVFTFDPSPESFFSGGKTKSLCTGEEKRKLLEEAGIEYLVEFPFRADTAAVSPEKFITDFLVGKMHAGFIAAGKDLSFGDRGKGDFVLLNRMAQELGYRTEKIDKVEFEGADISSTLIRGFLEKGMMREVRECLGRPYTLGGQVVHGRALGRKMGFPTLNIVPAPEKCLPPFGVYFSSAAVGAKTFSGITNIGCRPTVTEDREVMAETFLYNCDEDLYGKEVRIDFLEFYRAERKFDSLQELESEVGRNLAEGKRFHGI